MSTRKTVPTLAAAMLGLLLTAPTACANTGSIVNGRPHDVYGQIRTVDSRGGRIQVEEDYGRGYTFRYDGRTRVVYGDRSYPVSSLRRGDLVRVRLEYDRHGQAWADRIELRRDARVGGVGAGRRVERWNGTVRQVDYRAGWFVLDRSRTSDARVYLGRSTRREDARRFERLRRGQRVSVEVLVVGLGHLELLRFR